VKHVRKLRQWDLKDRILELLQGEPQPGARAYLDAVSQLGVPTYGFGLYSGEGARQTMWFSRAGRRETGMVRVQIKWPDFSQATDISPPDPDSIPEDQARIEFFRGKPIGHPTAIDPTWACEIVCAQLVIADQEAALAGMSDSNRRRILAKPINEALRVRWRSEDLEVAIVRSEVEAAQAQLWNMFSEDLASAGCAPERAFWKPGAHRSFFEEIGSAWAGRRLELIRTAQQLLAAVSPLGLGIRSTR